jgi:hypothetical protein
MGILHIHSQKHTATHPPIAWRLLSEVHEVNHWEPIVGIFGESNPLLSIKQAAQYLPGYPKYDIQIQVIQAVERMREDDMRRKIASVPGMTESGAASIWLYTLDGPLCRDLNGRLRSHDWEYLRNHYHPFMRILLTALKLLQNGEKRCFYHAVNRDIIGYESGEKKMYERDQSFVWWPFTSNSTDIETVRQRLGVDGMKTIFQTRSRSE